mgnify:CR=1 FL=1
MYYIDKIYWLIEDCKNYGTSSFAGLARSGFVSVDIMNSFVESKIMTQEEKNLFFEGIKTISSEILEDAVKVEVFPIYEQFIFQIDTYLKNLDS